MSPDEIGLLVLKIQDDDIRPSDLRKFLECILSDPEVRRNAGLAGKLSGLDKETRAKHCSANVMYLLSNAALAPTGDERPIFWMDTSTFFSEKFFFVLSGPWKEHLQVDGQKPTAADVLKARKRAKTTARLPLRVSSHLAEMLKALEQFWDTEGLLL